MPMYRLWRASDDKTFENVEGRDDTHAVALFSRHLGVTLTLEEKRHEVAPYMMGRREKEAAWTMAPDIPVWIKEADLSK